MPASSHPANTSARDLAATQPRLGQVCTAEGPLDLSAIYVIHHAIRRDLRDFAAAIPASPMSDENCWSALRARWNDLTKAIGNHTTVEDEYIWPAIAEHVTVAEAGSHDTLNAMATEHHELDALLDAVRRAFVLITSRTDEAGKQHLAAALHEARGAMLAHLAHEERAALPLMQRHLSVAEWKKLQRRAAKVYGFGDLGFAVPWSAHEIPSDQFGIAFAHGGPLVRVLLSMTRRRFERRHRTAFRHLMP